jgi:hypothetical protein
MKSATYDYIGLYDKDRDCLMHSFVYDKSAFVSNLATSTLPKGKVTSHLKKISNKLKEQYFEHLLMNCFEDQTVNRISYHKLDHIDQFDFLFGLLKNSNSIC